MKTVLWYLVVLLAILVGIIPVAYAIYGVNEGYLELKSTAAKGSELWWFFLYTHAYSGGIAILIGWLQFYKNLQTKYKMWHRTIGRIYMISALICAVSGFYIAFYAIGGTVSVLGFIMVAILYFYTTLQGFLFIRKRDIKAHQNMMTYSYAICLAAVSLRLMTTISQIVGWDYITSYQVISWLAWLPNIGVAYFINIRKE